VSRVVAGSGNPSLRSRLLRHILLPLLLTWALGTAVTMGVAYHFTERAFDRAMLDDAMLLASHLQLRDQQLQLDMSPVDLNTVLFDQSEKVFFAVRRWDGELVAGNPGLMAGGGNRSGGGGGNSIDRDNDIQYRNFWFQGLDLRAVVLARDTPVPSQVIVAMTTRSRSQLLQRLVLFSVLPQVLLLLLLAAWLRHSISADMRPLARLQLALSQRPAADLSPLPDSVSGAARTRDVESLAHSIDGLLFRIEQSVRAQREFAGNVAHELRTPLAGLRAAAEYGLAQSDPLLWREQLEVVLLSQDRANHLVDQLLALALADESRAHLQLQPLKLGELVREVVLRYLARADQAGVDLGADGLDGTDQALGDAVLLEGLLNNLLDNALRYGRALDGQSVINVELSHTDAGLCLSVTDNGVGIADAQRLSLTQRWVQGAPAQALALGQGAGLGLSIVDRYARLMNARLTLGPGPHGVGLRVAVLFHAAAHSA
jgi:two-component system sensor histidine kinase TctE